MKNKVTFLAALLYAVSTSTSSTPVCIKWNQTDPLNAKCAESQPGPVVTLMSIANTPFACQKSSPTATNCAWMTPLANALNKNK